MKQCTKCKQIKNESCFYKRRASKDGLVYICKLCTKAYGKTHRQEYTEKIKARGKKYRRKNYLRGIFRSMIQRCTDSKHKGYKNYGGRGISVLYKDLEEFKKDVGERPTDKHTIDRINNNGNYEPGNCRWTTWKHQSANKCRHCEGAYTLNVLLFSLYLSSISKKRAQI